MNTCPVCDEPLAKQEFRAGRKFFECGRCGPYLLSDEASEDLPTLLLRNRPDAEKLSYAIYRMTRKKNWPLITSEVLHAVIKNVTLPGPLEQLDNFVLWLGVRLPKLGATVSLGPSAISATGTGDIEGVRYLASEAQKLGLASGLIESTRDGNLFVGPLALTIEGWKRFELLRRGAVQGTQAFIAMQFGDHELDRIVAEHFKPAVLATGFDLKRLDENQAAGLIDDLLRVEIRRSRFVIAELTHQNRGAYWEAGFAEGLGKPVIYMCRKDVFDDRSKGTHFDTNHHLTVIWEPNHLQEAAEQLKATIRATLPEDAKMTEN